MTISPILDRFDLAEVVNHIGGIKVANLSVDEDGVHVELDSDTAVSDGTVLATRAHLPVTTVAPAFTEWTGSLTSGSDFTVTAYGEPLVTVVRARRRPLGSYRLAPALLLAASAAVGSALTLAAHQIGGTR